MFELLQKLIPSSVLQAQFMKLVRKGADWASAAIVTYLISKHASPTDASTIAGGVAAILMGGASFLFSMWEAHTQDAAVVTAAATGSVVAANDPQQRADVAQAIKTQAAEVQAAVSSPADKDAAIARLKDGTA